MLCALGLLSAALVADTLGLRSGGSVCRVDVEHGARIVSWQVRGEEMLWNPSVPQKDDGTWRHGGIPVVWPWQCDEYPEGVTNGPLHGVAWFSPFKVESRKAVDGGEELTDEEFDGEVWALCIPKAVQELAEEIAAWRENNPETDKTSESFGGYSYSRGQSASGGVGGWQAAFSGRLNAWRRPNDE